MPSSLLKAERAGATSVSLSATLLMAVLTTIAGCATPPASPHAPLNRWSQLGPDGVVSLRAIVTADDDCPTATVDGNEQRLQRRAEATAAAKPATSPSNPAYRPEFLVNSCELIVPASTRQASIAGQPVNLPHAHPQRIVVIGDTGCRIKVAAPSTNPPIQDCASSSAWPWQRIAAAAARTKPDLVIHVGDYHYREYCDNPTVCAPIREQQVVVGYGWPGWNADFFAPAAPLLTAAPWIMVRGNHENCDRAGDGWMRFLSPLPYQTCDDQLYRTATASVLANNRTANAYRVDLDEQLTLVVADNAGQQDYRPAAATSGDIELFRRQLRVLREIPESRQVWLLTHRPLWYDLLATSSQPNALQVALRKTLPKNVQMIVSGHEHAFETINFAATADPSSYPTGRPAQLIVGVGGTELEATDPQSPFYEGKTGAGSAERARPGKQLYDGVAASSGIVLNRHSFLLLERGSAGWSGTLLDADGLALGHCQLNGERKEIACSFPAP